MPNEALKKLGLTDKEAQAYLLLLELGVQPASVIAKKLAIPRSTAQFLLEKLAEKQFANKTLKNNVIFYEGEPPNNLKLIMERKKNLFLEDVKNQEQVIDELLPQLMQVKCAVAVKPAIVCYEGLENVAKSYIDFISDLPENSVLYNHVFPADFQHEKLRNVIHDFMHLRTQKKIFCKTITMLTEDSIKLKLTDKFFMRETLLGYEKTDTKFFAEKLICNDRLFILSYSARHMHSYILYNADIANMEMVEFKIAWERAKINDAAICKKKNTQALLKKFEKLKDY